MHAVVRSRVFFIRHRWIRWLVVLALSVGIGWVTFASLASVDRQRSQWGSSTDVVVAASDLQPDGAFDTEIVAFPDALVPDDALSVLPSDARLRRSVGTGEVLTHADISPSPGPAGLAEPGVAVVGLVDPMARSVVVGLDVRIASEGIILAEHATVVGVVDDIVFVAVTDADAAMVAAASQSGLASLIFVS